MQDCLERAIGHWYQRRAGGDARTWAFTILHNLALTRLQRMARRPPQIAIEDADERQLGRAAAQEDGLRYRELLTALSRLPQEQRTVLLLVTVEELSYLETAKVLDIPVGTVMSRLSRARDRLLRVMADEARPEPIRPQLRRVK